MTNYKEILRLHSLGINNTRIASGCGCSRTTVINVLQRAKEQGLSWQSVSDLSDKELSQLLFPVESVKPTYKMPDCEYLHREWSMIHHLLSSRIYWGIQTRTPRQFI